MDDKRQIILKAAIQVFTRYGYRRTSMDDIASEAGISRPAIYQYFRNKDDVFSCGVDMVITRAFNEAEEAGARHDEPLDTLKAFIIAYMRFYYRLVVAGPHAAEILDVNSQLGAEKTRQARLRLVHRLNEIVGDLPEAQTGYILAHAAEGVKHQSPDEKTLASRLAILVDRFMAG